MMVDHNGHEYLAIDLLRRDFGGLQSDITYTLQASEDLANWETVTEFDERVSGADVANTVRVRLIDLSRNSDEFERRFLRVLVELDTP